MNMDDLMASSPIREQLDEHIDTVNRTLSRWEQIKQYRVITTPISIESGELTPSMKVKRGVVEQRYRDLIDEMYAT